MKWPRRIVAIGIIQLMLLALLGAAALAFGEETEGASGYISGSVFYDLDGNGQANVGEPNAAGAMVFIQGEGETIPLVLTTDAEGFFVARELPYGVYRIWAQDARSNRSAMQSVTLDEVNGASSIDLPIPGGASGGAHVRFANSIFLPLVNR
ncbi:MAG: carboxypeptidase-like regulatory domain-containing protein [Caldilinea sp.]|nr:carboxypeptidase-like regulatory domain-containing protein [Caldilinea sp.]MDW8440429.1 carboxypeptidase-like regulatory domain-containing protein [Caldilineaceae bacterium]